jgi:hypothetical protein
MFSTSSVRIGSRSLSNADDAVSPRVAATAVAAIPPTAAPIRWVRSDDRSWVFPRRDPVMCATSESTLSRALRARAFFRATLQVSIANNRRRRSSHRTCAGLTIERGCNTPRVIAYIVGDKQRSVGLGPQTGARDGHSWRPSEMREYVVCSFSMRHRCAWTIPGPIGARPARRRHRSRVSVHHPRLRRGWRCRMEPSPRDTARRRRDGCW